jgi:hypothetical protein
MSVPDPLSPLLDERELGDLLARVCAIGPRFVGTEGERRARRLIEQEFVAAGLERVRLEPVSVLAYQPDGESHLSIGDEPKLPVTGLQFTRSGSVEAEAVNLGSAETDADLDWLEGDAAAVEGRIAVIRTDYPYAVLPPLVARGIVGVVVLGDTPDGLLAHFSAQLYPPSEPPSFPGVPLAVPGVTVEASAGRRLVERIAAGPQVLRLRHSACYAPAETANVIGEVVGETDERVVVGAHYDSQLETPGACDNAGGVSALIALARRCAGLRPLRTIVFAAFADEEHGCYGSLQYCRRHMASLDATVAMVNLDALGCRGDAKRALWADPSIRDFCFNQAVEQGWIPEHEREASTFSGSDYNPFIDAGVPSAFFWRYPPGNLYYHSAGDSLERVDVGVIGETANVAGRVVIALSRQKGLDFGRARPTRRWLDLRPGSHGG